MICPDIYHTDVADDLDRETYRLLNRVRKRLGAVLDRVVEFIVGRFIDFAFREELSESESERNACHAAEAQAYSRLRHLEYLARQEFLAQERKCARKKAIAQAVQTPKPPHKAQSRSRFRIDPRDVPQEAIAWRIGLTEQQFIARYPNLKERGFPAPDPDTGLYDMPAVDRWCDARNPHLFGGDGVMQARDARMVAKERIEKMKAGAGERG
jgi:hypothetical protein